MKWMERWKRSLNTRMKHDDDDAVNKIQIWATVCVHLNKEDSQETTTLTDNKKRETTKTKDLQCMMTHALASTTLTLTCSQSVSCHFTHCWVSLCASFRQLNSCRWNHLLNFDLYREFLVEIHTAKTGLLRCCLYMSSMSSGSKYWIPIIFWALSSFGFSTPKCCFSFFVESFSMCSTKLLTMNDRTWMLLELRLIFSMDHMSAFGGFL